MIVRKAAFAKSSSKLSQCVKGNLPEFGFIGRSNVGKSSLINMLCNNNKLAKTSASPGKTKLINHFLINDQWYVVDLPGYGYAKTSKVQKAEFEGIIIDYCSKRENLVCLFVLIDSRLPLQQIDAEFLRWCGENNIPFSIIYTKADKNSKLELKRNIEKIEEKLLLVFDEIPNTFTTSAEKHLGKEGILSFIESFLK
jgi:GTP-binding protein